MSLSAPSHRFKQPDGKRYPSARPDGLVYQKQLRELLGIAETTLLRWQKLGWITPEGKDGHCTLYRVPTPERVEEIRAMAAERATAGALRGRQSQMAQGAHLDRAKNGRESKTRQAQQRAAQGLLNKRGLCELLGTHCQTLNEWIEAGIITPALVSETGKWMWFTQPDELTMERLRSVAKGRTKARLSPESEEPHGEASELHREKRSYTKSGARSTVNIVRGVKTRLARGQNPAGTISFDEAAQWAGVAVETMRHWVQKGWVASERVGRFNGGVYPEALETFLAERERQKQIHPTAPLGVVQEVPEGALCSSDLAKHLGLSIATIYRWTSAGHLTPVVQLGSGRKTKFFMVPTPGRILAIQALMREAHAEVGRRNQKHRWPEDRPAKTVKAKPSPELKEKPQAKEKAAPKPKIQAPKIAAAPTVAVKLPSFTVVAQPEPVASTKVAGYVSHTEAVGLGRSEARFQTVLGFNLLQHPELGFRAAVVSEKAEQGWRYYERHFINGYGQWQVKAQKPLTGEIVL